MMHRQKMIENRMRRQKGMTPTAQVRLAAFNQKQEDWHGKCRKCGKSRVGTLADLSKPCQCDG